MILIGTSGFDYPEWKGVFYPQDLKREEFLEFYATQFNALEVNNSFYNMPDQHRLLKFYERTEGNLFFSIKANKSLTHEIDGNWKKRAEEMRIATLPLMQKGVLASILFQLPQSFHYTPQNRYYLAELLQEFDGYPVSVEFRHKEWIKPSVFEGLEKRGASIVFCDMPQLKALPDGTECKTPFVGPWAYLRMHGRNGSAWYASGQTPNGSGRYDYDYSVSELESFVPVVQAALNEKRMIQAYFNNHPRGNGARNAGEFRMILNKVFKK